LPAFVYSSLCPSFRFFPCCFFLSMFFSPLLLCTVLLFCRPFNSASFVFLTLFPPFSCPA
jgi:hypothetical protein